MSSQRLSFPRSSNLADDLRQPGTAVLIQESSKAGDSHLTNNNLLLWQLRRQLTNWTPQSLYPRAQVHN